MQSQNCIHKITELKIQAERFKRPNKKEKLQFIFFCLFNSLFTSFSWTMQHVVQPKTTEKCLKQLQDWVKPNIHHTTSSRLMVMQNFLAKFTVSLNENLLKVPELMPSATRLKMLQPETFSLETKKNFVTELSEVLMDICNRTDIFTSPDTLLISMDIGEFNNLIILTFNWAYFWSIAVQKVKREKPKKMDRWDLNFKSSRHSPQNRIQSEIKRVKIIIIPRQPHFLIHSKQLSLKSIPQ